MHNHPDILLTNSYFYPMDEKQWNTAEPYAPLGTITAAAVLREHAFHFDFIDNCLERSGAQVKQRLNTESYKYFIIYEDGFNYLTKMCLTTMQDAAFDMIKTAKQQQCIVIVNGSDATDHTDKYHAAGADYIIHGEGEMALLELLNSLENTTGHEDILGISYRTDDATKKNPTRPVLRDLDQLPIAAWDLIDVSKYREIWLNAHGYFAMNIATTRGCPYKCNWCAKPIYGNRYNSRSPQHVMAEISQLIAEYSVNYFWMCDDIFGLKPSWVQQFRDLKYDQKLDFKYKIQSRVDLMLKEDNLDALSDSGLDEVWIGAESGSQTILDAMDKGTQVEQIYDATKKLKLRNIKVAFFLQFGYLGETRADIKKTISMVLDLMPDNIGISVSYPLPGTGFYDKVKSELKQKTNWVDSDDLALMFNNTYPPAFYKVLHRYVHNRYRIKKGYLMLMNLFQKNTSSINQKASDFARMIYHIPMAMINVILLSVHAKKSS